MRSPTLSTMFLGLLLCCGAVGCAKYTQYEEQEARKLGFLQRDLVLKQPCRLEMAGSINYLAMRRDVDPSSHSETVSLPKRAISPGAHLRIDGIASQFEIDPVPSEVYGNLFLPGEKPLAFRYPWNPFALFPWETKVEALRRIRKMEGPTPAEARGDEAQRFAMAKSGALERIEQSGAH